jgi:multiple sugar transport system substrate-binding protein
MKKAATVFVLIVCITLINSCSSQDSEDTVITFWQFWDLVAVEELVREFEAQHPGIRVEVEQLTWKSGLQKIQAAVASGTQPDLCELGSTWVPRFSYSGVLEDMTYIYNAVADSFLMWDSAKWAGRVYGLPWLQGSRALFFNKTLFTRAGLDPNSPPETWDELLDAAKRIDALGPDIYGFGLNLGERYVLYKKFMAFAWGNGGRILSDDGTVVFNSDENLEALNFYLKLAKYSLKEKQEVFDHQFKMGKLGMQVSGAWNLKNYATEAPDLDYGVALVPKPSHEKGTHASFAGAELLVIFKNSKHKEEALKLARFLQSYPMAKQISLAERSVFPASKRSLWDAAFLHDDKVKVFVRQALTSRSAPAHPGWIEMEDVINRSIEEVLYGRIGPEDALNSAAAKLHEIVSQYESN